MCACFFFEQLVTTGNERFQTTLSYLSREFQGSKIVKEQVAEFAKQRERSLLLCLCVS